MGGTGLGDGVGVSLPSVQLGQVVSLPMLAYAELGLHGRNVSETTLRHYEHHEIAIRT